MDWMVAKDDMIFSHDATLTLMMLRSFSNSHGCHCACDLCFIYPLSAIKKTAIIYLNLFMSQSKSAFFHHNCRYISSIINIIVVILKYLLINQTALYVKMTLLTNISFPNLGHTEFNLPRRTSIDVQYWLALSQVSLLCSSCRSHPLQVSRASKNVRHCARHA